MRLFVISGLAGVALLSCFASLFSIGAEDERMQRVFALVEATRTGSRLFDQARDAWGLKTRREVLSRVRWGDVSRTDAVLTRHYETGTQKEVRARDVTVVIRRDQGIIEMALDLAHELTHAIQDPLWDPYDPDLTVSRYISVSIDGRGGEAEALKQECEVAVELYHHLGIPLDRCVRYIKKGKVSLREIRKDFYRVGDWKKTLGLRLEASPVAALLSAEEPELISSTGQAPYPVSLFNEYVSFSKTACQNTKNRLKATRSPASEGVRRFLKNRCLPFDHK